MVGTAHSPRTHGDGLPDAAVARVVDHLQLPAEVERHGRPDFLPDQPVLAVPGVGPEAVGGEVSVEVVGERLAGLRPKEGSRVRGYEVRAVGAAALDHGHVGDSDIGGEGAVRGDGLAPPVFPITHGGVQVDRDGGIGRGQADDGDGRGVIPAPVLVEEVGRKTDNDIGRRFQMLRRE